MRGELGGAHLPNAHMVMTTEEIEKVEHGVTKKVRRLKREVTEKLPLFQRKVYQYITENKLHSNQIIFGKNYTDIYL